MRMFYQMPEIPVYTDDGREPEWDLVRVTRVYVRTFGHCRNSPVELSE
jgi:hypothetical protein